MIWILFLHFSKLFDVLFSNIYQLMLVALAAHILKIVTTQRRSAWPLLKDDKQIREVVHIKKKIPAIFKSIREYPILYFLPVRFYLIFNLAIFLCYK